MNRQDFAQTISNKLRAHATDLSKQFSQSDRIPSFVLDDLLPLDLAQKVAKQFPSSETLTLKNSLKERKYVTSQMNHCPKEIEELIFAFQEPSVIKAMEEITGMKALLPDDLLYAAGLSSMSKGCFLNPHLDNSHDLSGKKYRVLNLLYYVSEDWKLDNGGNLELWDRGLKQEPRTILSQFNRLVVMQTSKRSLHSVTPVVSQQPRQCISTYLFSAASVEGHAYYHVTSFFARPEQRWRAMALQADLALRSLVGKTLRFFTKGNVGTSHLYKKQ